MRWYYAIMRGHHKITSYDKIQNWLLGLWVAQVSNAKFDKQKTRTQGVLSIVLYPYTLESAMSTVFDPQNQMSEQELRDTKDILQEVEYFETMLSRPWKVNICEAVPMECLLTLSRRRSPKSTAATKVQNLLWRC